MNIFKILKQKKLKRLQSEARDLAWAMAYDKENYEIGYKNLNKIQQQIAQLEKELK